MVGTGTRGIHGCGCSGLESQPAINPLSRGAGVLTYIKQVCKSLIFECRIRNLQRKVDMDVWKKCRLSVVHINPSRLSAGRHDPGWREF